MKHFSALPSWVMHLCQHVYFLTFKQYWKNWSSSQRGKTHVNKKKLSRTWEMGMSKFTREEIHMNILEGMAWSAVAVHALAISNQWHFSLEWQIFFYRWLWYCWQCRDGLYRAIENINRTLVQAAGEMVQCLRAHAEFDSQHSGQEPHNHLTCNSS